MSDLNQATIVPNDGALRYPGFTASPTIMKHAQDFVWQDLRALRNREDAELTDVQKLVHALHQYEVRQRTFFRGAVLWITIGAPIVWGVFWVVVSALAVRGGG